MTCNNCQGSNIPPKPVGIIPLEGVENLIELARNDPDFTVESLGVQIRKGNIKVILAGSTLVEGEIETVTFPLLEMYPEQP